MTASQSFAAAARQAASLEDTAHRPWPVPSRAWRMRHSWENLLFAHWRVPHDQIREHVPPGLELETFAGSAWMGVAAFRLTHLRLRGAPPPPVASSFLELNVRTPVRLGDRPGVWFFSLDASSRLAVRVARLTYRLPYFHARMRSSRADDTLEFESSRTAAGEPRVFSARYRPTGPPFEARPETLEWFLYERYRLYTKRRDRLLAAEIHHGLWPLQSVEGRIELNTMAPAGIDLSDDEPLLHFSERQDVVIWPLESLRV